jgi:hypothetical protein
MKIEDAQNARVFQYVTSSGLIVETLNNTVPVFNPYNAAFHWYNLLNSVDLRDVSSSIEIVSCDIAAGTAVYPSYTFLEQTPQPLYFGGIKIPVVDAAPMTSGWFGEDPTTPWGTLEDSHDPFADFYLNASFAELNQQAISCLETQKRVIVGYIPNAPVSMSASDKERIEVAAKDHTTHLESLTLSREHSNPNFLSTTYQRLKQFGWGLWLKRSDLSKDASTFWSRIATVLEPRQYFAAGFDPLT